MDSKNNNVKRKSLLITIFSIVSAFLVGTFAWLSWRSQNTAMVLTVGEIDGLSVTLKPYQISTSLVPSNTYTNQNYVNVTATNKKNRSGNFSLFYRVTSIDEDLIDDGFKYTIVKSTDNWATQTVAKTGDFSSAVSGSNLIIYDEKIPGNNTTYQYKVYLWIDNQDSNQNQMQNKVFTGELRADLCYEPATIPKLDQGMIPVTIANNGTVTTVSENDENWYSYCDKKWANVVLVKDSGVKTRAQNKVAGTTIDRSDILAYYVWIPRYKYSMMSCKQLTNPNLSDNPECYGYGATSEVRESIINQYIDFAAAQQPELTTEQLEEGRTTINQQIQANGDGLLITIYEFMGYHWLDDADLEILASQNDITLEQMQQQYQNIVFGSSNSALNQLIKMVYEYNASKGANDPAITPAFDFEPVLIDGKVTSEKPINIVFENVLSSKSMGTAVGTSYYTHPAFTFGNRELSGIWVGKFETTGNPTTPTVLDNISSFRYWKVSWFFETAQKFGTSTYGIVSSDAHMMKNREWGAVAYLSHSRYGVNTEVRINNNSSYMTGCGASSENGSSTSNCEIQYGNASSYPQSTTGNISGIFDMSGGAGEYVMGYGRDYAITTTREYSGFGGTMPDAKYLDSYRASGICTGSNCLGHALSETAGWYNDNNTYVSDFNPWFYRGGVAGGDGSTCGVFSFKESTGESRNDISFRSVLVEDDGSVEVEVEGS